MTAVPKSNTYYTAEAYLQQERNATHKSEYYKGEIFAMAGASLNHNRIVSNIIFAIRDGLRKKGKNCEVFPSDLRLHIPANTLYTYPDVSVICGEPQFTDDNFDVITNPIVLVEVLSESTKSYDRGEKFKLYRDIETLQNYVLVASDSHLVEVFTKKTDNLWELRIYENFDENVELGSLNISVSMQEIYLNVSFASEKKTS
jgi:Uma2 family endonuclease